MVLVVKRHLAAPVRPFSGGGGGCPRLAAEVHDLGGWRKQHSPAPLAYRRAEVDVFGVHEIALIHIAHRFGIGAPDEQAGAADPIDVAETPGKRFNVRGDEASSFAPSHQDLLPELSERRQ